MQFGISSHYVNITIAKERVQSSPRIFTFRRPSPDWTHSQTDVGRVVPFSQFPSATSSEVLGSPP